MLSLSMLFVGTGRALALANPQVPPVAVYAGAGEAAAVAEGVGTAVTVSGVAEGVAAGGAVIAGAPILLTAGAVLAGAGVVYLGWRWLSGHDPNYANGPAGTTNYTGGWATTASCSGAYCTGSIKIGTLAGATGVKVIGVAVNGTSNFQGGAETCINTCQSLAPGAVQSFNLQTTTGTASGACFGAANDQGGGYLWVASVPTPNVAACQQLFNGLPPTPAVTTVVTTTPTSQCSNGSTTTTISGPPITYAPSADPATLPPILAPACPAGTQRIGFTTPSTGAGGATVPQPLTWTAPPVPGNFPNCAPGGSAAPCQMTLTSTDPAGKTTNCTGTGLCTYYPAPNPDGSTYSCKWGPYTMPASDCTTVATKTATGTTTADANDPCTQPVTGASQGCAAPNPTDGSQGCGGATAIFHPVQLATCLVEPSAATMTRLQAEGTSLNNKPPLSILTAAGGWLAAFGTIGQVCPDWAVSVLGHSFGIVCSSPFMQQMHSIRLLTGAALIAVAFSGFLWSAWHSAIPAISVHPNSRRGARE